MIYCSQCGTANKPNSKFCKNCAAPLAPSTDVRCPICGTMNPQGATTCSNCGSRLVTNAAGASVADSTTPADAPETIEPFNPPEVSQESEEPPAPTPQSHSSSRPTFGRANSEWLKRIRKTTPASAPTADERRTTDDPSASSEQAQRPETAPMVEETAPSAEVNPPIAENAGTQVTEVAASQAADMVAPAMQGDVTSEVAAPSAPVAAARDAPAQITQVVPTAETTPTAAPPNTITSPTQNAALPEMKLTGDNYDYSDIGGQVTEEMKAQLEAQSSNISSVEDEVALARRLLGLDVETTADQGQPTAEVAAPQPTSAPAAETPVIETPKAEAPAVETTVVETPKAEIVSPAHVSEPVEAARTVETATTPPAEEKEGKGADWMTALAAASSTAVAEATADSQSFDQLRTSSPTAEAAVPDVASDVTPSATVETAESAAPTTQVGTTPPSSEIPDWVRELAPRESTAEEGAGEVATAGEAEGEVPAWVQELAPEATPIGASALLDRLPELDEQEREELPDWLREPVPTEPEVAVPSEEVTANEEPETPLVEPSPAPIGTFDLPSWFTLGAQPPSNLPADPFETIETTGPLAGVSGILPLAVAITEPHTLIPSSPVKSDGGRVFQTILAEPLAPAARAPTEAISKPLFTKNHLIYLLILLAALVPMFLPLEQAGLGLNTGSGPSADFYSQLQAVPAGGTVLVAFDYSPGQGVELNPAASVIVNDLAAQHVNIVALSTNPYGAALAQNILGQAQAAQPNFTFVNLGFLFGNEAGLRNLAPGAGTNLNQLALGWLPADRPDVNGTPWGVSPLAQQIRSFNDLALAVIIAGDDSDLRAWMEQVQPHVKSPLVAATTAGLEPQARTYVNAKQLQASLRGLTGAAELELSSNRTGPVVKTVDALSVVSLLLAGIIVLANVAWLVRRK